MEQKKPTAHRQGNLIAFFDAIQEMIEVEQSDDFWIFDDNNVYDGGRPNPKRVEQLKSILDKINSFNITKIGNLYLTTGGRIVLDKGYGEYFNSGDKIVFTLDELKSGIKLDKFKKKINEL